MAIASLSNSASSSLDGVYRVDPGIPKEPE